MTAINFKSLMWRLKDQGWELTRTTKGHYKAKPPNAEDGRVILISDSTDHHAIHNNISRLEKMGFILNRPRGPRRKKATEHAPTVAAPQQSPTTSQTTLRDLLRVFKDAVEFARLCEAQVGETMQAVQKAQRAHDDAVREAHEAKQSMNEAMDALLLRASEVLA